MSRYFKNVVALSKRPEDFHVPQPAVLTELTTVVVDQATTVVDDSVTTVVGEPETSRTGHPQTTVVDYPTTTVVPESPATVVVDYEAPVVATDLVCAANLWRAELNGELFRATRVRRIDLAQDALTHSEESVYDFLWGRKNIEREEYRIAQVGYDRIAKASRVTKRNAALIVERLIKKGFIEPHAPPDTSKRQPAQYRVLSYRSALEAMRKIGRQYVVRTGNGVLFVHPVTLVLHPTTPPTTTVVAESPTTVVARASTTVAAATTVTVVAGVSTTVVAATTPLDSKDKIESQTSSSRTDVDTVSRIVSNHLAIDDDAIRQVVANCRSADPRATADEIAHFAHTIVVNNRHNPNVKNIRGLLITSTARFFEPGSRELAALRKKHQQDRLEEVNILQRILQDPDSTDTDREWARTELIRLQPQ